MLVINIRPINLPVVYELSLGIKIGDLEMNYRYRERRNGPYYFALFHRLRYSVASGAQCVKVVADVVFKKFTFAISSPDEFLV